MSLEDAYLQMSENDIDKILMGLSLDDETEEVEEEKCKSCGSTRLYLDETKGYVVCQDCAVIHKEILNDNPEFNNDMNGTSRYGAPSNYFYPKSALGTKIKSRSFNRITALQRQGQMPYREKSLLCVLNNLQKKCKSFHTYLLHSCQLLKIFPPNLSKIRQNYNLPNKIR